jgi:hypothetical protein
MAYSIIEFKDKSIRVHDLDLAVACFLLMEQGKTVGSEFVAKLFEDWVDSISFDGPGCINLQLDENLVDAKSVQALRDLINSTMQSLNEESDLYSKEKLNSILAKAKISLESDYRVDLIRGALVELRTLVD